MKRHQNLKKYSQVLSTEMIASESLVVDESELTEKFWSDNDSEWEVSDFCILIDSGSD